MTADFSTPSSSYADQGTIENWVIDGYASIESQLESQLLWQRPTPTTIERHARLLQILGAVQLGLLVASCCIFANFVVLTLIFHMQP